MVRARPLPGFRLEVEFADGTQGLIDLAHLVNGERAGVFAGLRDEKVFRAVTIEHGAVAWPGDVDLAPDAMYEEIRKHGTWNVR